MLYSMKSYVVAEKFFENQFPDSFRRLEDFLGFVAEKVVGDHVYYIACTIPYINGPVCMYAVSDYPLGLKGSSLNELIARLNDAAKRTSIKQNPSGVCYSYCTHEILSAPISEKVLLLMCSQCLCVLMDFETQASKTVQGEDLLLVLDRQPSVFPYCLEDLKAFMDGTKEDPWHADALPLTPVQRRQNRFYFLSEYDKAQKWLAQQEEISDSNK